PRQGAHRRAPHLGAHPGPAAPDLRGAVMNLPLEELTSAEQARAVLKTERRVRARLSATEWLSLLRELSAMDAHGDKRRSRLGTVWVILAIVAVAALFFGLF